MKLLDFFVLLTFILNFIFSQNSNTLEDSENIKYIEFSFKRNLTSNKILEPEDFFKTYFYNQIYTNIKVGSNKVEIPFYFYLQQFSFAIQSSNVDNSQVKGKYNELKSGNYESLEEIKYFDKGDIQKAILSKDIFYFSNNKQSSIKFYLTKENSDKAHITEGGKIGFRLYPQFNESKESSFITNLKDNKLITSNILTFKYDSNKTEEDSGKLYIGAYPHAFSPERYNEKNYIKGIGINSEGFWTYFFDEVKIGNKVLDRSKESYFYSELGFIIGTENFFNFINSNDAWLEYFNASKKCYKKNFRIDDFEGNERTNYRFIYEFTGYYCDKDVDIEKFNIGELSFLNKSMNYYFNFTFKDLWIEKNGFKYFMILQTLLPENIWFFGKPFFKKYQMVFELDNKAIGFYTYINEKNSKIKKNNKNILIYIVVIIVLLIIIFGLVFLLIKCYFSLPRKKRANELLDENYEYSEQNIN